MLLSSPRPATPGRQAQQRFPHPIWPRMRGNPRRLNPSSARSPRASCVPAENAKKPFRRSRGTASIAVALSQISLQESSRRPRSLYRPPCPPQQGMGLTGLLRAMRSVPNRAPSPKASPRRSRQPVRKRTRSPRTLWRTRAPRARTSLPLNMNPDPSPSLSPIRSPACLPMMSLNASAGPSMTSIQLERISSACRDAHSPCPPRYYGQAPEDTDHVLHRMWLPDRSNRPHVRRVPVSSTARGICRPGTGARG